MSKTIRAKFKVLSITAYPDNSQRVVMGAVTDTDPENKSFWQNTPTAGIEMHITNPDAKIEFGEYYVDFTKSDT